MYLTSSIGGFEKFAISSNCLLGPCKRSIHAGFNCHDRGGSNSSWPGSSGVDVVTIAAAVKMLVCINARRSMTCSSYFFKETTPGCCNVELADEVSVRNG